MFRNMQKYWFPIHFIDILERRGEGTGGHSSFLPYQASMTSLVPMVALPKANFLKISTHYHSTHNRTNKLGKEQVLLQPSAYIILSD